MPQFAHLLLRSDSQQQQSLRPFIVRPNSGSAASSPIAFIGQCISRRTCALLICVSVVVLLYVQLFQFPSELQQVDEAISSRQRERYLSSYSDHGQKSVADLSNRLHPKQVVLAKIPTFKGPSNERQRAVRDAFKHAWANYKLFAWGHDHLRPISRTYQEWLECGLTIVDSLDTLLIMDLKDEFGDAKHWVETELKFDKNRFVSLFETTIRVLGGLLSAYHLSGDIVFLSKAQDIGRRLFPAISSSPTAVPFSDVNLQTSLGRQPSWSMDSSLAEVASIQLEFRELSRVTGNASYEHLSFRVSEHIHASECVREQGGLCGMYVSPTDGRFRAPSVITFGARADSYYEYLLKQWLQTGKTINWLEADYRQAMESMRQKLWQHSEPNRLYFVGELLSEGKFSPKMDHLVCYLAGILALGTKHGMPAVHMEMARNLSATCHAMYQNPTGLGPEIAWFNIGETKGNEKPMDDDGNRNLTERQRPDLYIKPLDAHSLLRPEAFEAWFYMHRLTGDRVYQKWGWEAFQAIERYARLDSGYASVQNVKRIPVQHRDMMESFFLAESLKYLYLLLDDDQSVLPLDKWVFNTEAHPLPIHAS